MSISTAGDCDMIKLLVERDRPPTFNLASDKEVAWHARVDRKSVV